VKPPPDGDVDGTFGPNAQGAPEGFIMAMTLDLSRWQFGITTVFHFMFVPLTIGLALLLAIMQTRPTGPARTRRDTTSGTT